MRCTDPRTVGFTANGLITFSSKERHKEQPAFKLPCGQCIDCRLDYGRQWATRCVHEASMHAKNAFITLTYNDENLPGPKLVYDDFQKFMKRLRRLQNDPIGMFVTGEYGEKNKRPHWHAITFGWAPSDGVPAHQNKHGDQLFTSETLTNLWGKGNCDFGSVTLKSAGYCARYAAKKLVHDRAFNDEYKPISKKSSKHAIGKKWLEQNYKNLFSLGKLNYREGDKIISLPIPRYYERWLKENDPTLYRDYVLQKFEKISAATAAAERQTLSEDPLDYGQSLECEVDAWQKRRRKAQKKITEQKLELLQNGLKL